MKVSAGLLTLNPELFPNQDTLAYATALLNEKDQSGSSNGSESSPANENGDRHLQQVTIK